MSTLDGYSFNGMFFLTLTATLIGFFGVLVSACLKSKCKHVSCCGFNVDRDVEIELAEEKLEIEHNIPYTTPPPMGPPTPYLTKPL